MKLKTLLCLVTGLVALAAGKASAFPLNLTSLSGTITSTSDFTNDPSTTTNKAKVVSINLKQVLTVVSNEVYIRSTNTIVVPAASRIVFDPYIGVTYITNNNGFYYNLSEPPDGGQAIASTSIRDMATNFHQVGSNGGTESDVTAFVFWVYGRGTDGLYYYFGVYYGRGKVLYNVNGTTGKVTMTMTGAGSDYGEYKSSDDGVTTGSVVFTGSAAAPQWEGPYSTFWW
jgi:hypothetical protein